MKRIVILSFLFLFLLSMVCFASTDPNTGVSIPRVSSDIHIAKSDPAKPARGDEAPAAANRPAVQEPAKTAAMQNVSAHDGYSGTGFFLTKEIIVTNWHVVKDKATINVDFKGHMSNARVIASDPNNDLALLEIGKVAISDKINPFPIANVKKVNIGEKVYAVGFPDANKFGLRPKITDGLLNSASGYQDDPRFFQVSIPIQPGNSGSPVINDQGQVVGIITKTVSRSSGHIYQNVNYALKINHVINLLISLPDSIIVPEDPIFSRQSDGVDIMNYARDAVVRVVTSD